MNINNEQIELLAKAQVKLFLKQHPLSEDDKVSVFHSNVFQASLARLHSATPGSPLHLAYYATFMRLCYDLADIRNEALKNVN